MQSFVFPGNIDPTIMAIGEKPFIYMRTDEFSAINLESERILLDLIHCPGGKTIIYTGSGTGAMSAVVENYVSTKKKAFVIDGGSFGHRWLQLCQYYGVEAFRYEVPFAKDIDYQNLEETLKRERPDVLLCQHHETSSGQLFDIKTIASLCKQLDIRLVVDIISTFLAEPFDMAELGADICVTSTQKGLNIPPGLSVLFLSPALEGYQFAHRGYYWDFEDNLNNLKRGQTPFSPATILYLQLNARLNQIVEQGGTEFCIEQVAKRCSTFRGYLADKGYFPLAQTPSQAITGFQTADTKERKIFRGLIDKYDTYIMPGGRDGFYRVSHMGLQTDEELRLLVERIKEFEP